MLDESNTNEQFVEPKLEDEENQEQTEEKVEETVKESSAEQTNEQKSEEKTEEIDKEEKKEVSFQDFLKDRGVEFEHVVEKEEVKPKKPFIPRVLDDIPEEDRPLFKNMSIESFSKLKPIYLEHQKLKQENESLKQAKSKESASVYGHPKAFMLTKQYETHVNDYNLAEKIKSHWALQAAKVSRGEKWQDLDMDPKTGKLVLSDLKESNAESEAFIGDQLQFAREQSFEASKGLKNYVDNYGKTYDSDIQVINGAIEKYFPGYTNKDHPTKDIQKAVIDALPASFRDNPVSQLLALTAANNAILLGRLKKLQNELNKIKGIESDVKETQPKKKEFVSGNNKSGAVKFSDFAARRAQDV